MKLDTKSKIMIFLIITTLVIPSLVSASTPTGNQFLDTLIRSLQNIINNFNNYAIRHNLPFRVNIDLIQSVTTTTSTIIPTTTTTTQTLTTTTTIPVTSTTTQTQTSYSTTTTTVDLCANVNCPDICNGNSRLYNGYCYLGSCYYQDTVGCTYGCSNGVCNKPPWCFPQGFCTTTADCNQNGLPNGCQLNCYQNKCVPNALGLCGCGPFAAP